MAIKRARTVPKIPEDLPVEETRPRPTGKGGKVSAMDAGAAVAVQTAASHDQFALYEAATRLFHAGNYREARELFAKATKGPDRGVSHRADLHVRMCDRRSEQPVPLPDTVEDHYNYAVALINARDLAGAREHLRAALQLDLGADHVYYALALCEALSGNLQGAGESLRTAIELEPRNRIAARQDADFAPFVHHPQLERVLNPGNKD